MRGATYYNQLYKSALLISIHAPRERSDAYLEVIRNGMGISIHAPRERSDTFITIFFSFDKISIHAPRERSDVSKSDNDTPNLYFNPRSS